MDRNEDAEPLGLGEMSDPEKDFFAALPRFDEVGLECETLEVAA